MGEVVSLVTQAINFGKQAKVEADREKNRKLQKEADRLSKPISPPEFWPDLKSRRKQTPTGPYSVEGIRESLSSLILPVGWSEEQLIDVGFEMEISEYRDGVDQERKDLFGSFAQTLEALAKAVGSTLTGADLQQRQAFSRAGIDRSTVNRFSALAQKAKEGKLEPAGVSAAIDELRTLLDKATLQRDIAQGMEDSQKDIAAASDARSSALLGLVRRSIGVRSRPVAVS